MSSTKFNFGRRKTLGIEPKNEEKVHIKIPLETGGFWEKDYLQNDLIGNVINDFKDENHVDIPQNYLMDWNFKNKSLKMTDKIKTLIVQEVPTICLNPEMKKKPLEIQEEEIIPKIVGKPFNNPFELYLFKKSDKILKIQTYDENIVEDLGLNHYSSSSAYCNGNNKLFISGGETKNNEIINKLWAIDLENNFINVPKIIFPKKDHSMIFIPPKYVFLVGGNDKKTFYYDSELQEIYDWANLNEERTEPALQRIGDTLYCFENVNKPNNQQMTFEKTLLNSNDPKWDLIYPKFDPSLYNNKLPQKFFAVSRDSDNSVIFLGGNMDLFADGNKLVNYKYNPDNNLIEPTNVSYKDYNFKEKTFLPYNKNIDYILPDFNRQHPEVVFYVRNKSKVEKVDYKPNFDINKKKLLRGSKRPLYDTKYDFNMPSIIIPSNNYNANLNINENIKLKAEPKKYMSPYAIKDINEPTFQNYDYNYNNKIEQPPPFKEAEIEANKGDQRLSIEIPNDIIESTREREKEREKERDKKDIDFNIQIKEEEKNEEKKIESKNPKIQLRYVPRPPQNYNRQIYTNTPLEQNELVIPKFHYSVNDPGNELIITRKGKVYTSYVPREPTRIKSSYGNLNIKSSRLEKDDLILPNYNYSVNLNMDNEYRSKSPGSFGMSARNMKMTGNMDGDIPIPNIHLPKSGNINLNAIASDSANYKFSGNIPEINVKEPKINGPSGNINIKGSYSPDFEMSGFIPGTKSQKIKIKGNNINTPDYSLSGRIPGVNMKGKDINIKGPNINTPDYSLSGKIPGAKINGPKIDMKSPNINLNSPDLKINGPKIDGSKIDIKASNFYGPEYNISGKIPGVNVNKPKIDLKGPNIDLKGPNINPPDYNISGKIPGIDIDNPKIDLKGPNIDLKGPNLKGPDYNISGKIPGVDVNKPKIDLKGPNIDLKGPNINPPDYNISGKIPGIDIDNPKIDLKGPNIKGPDYNISGTIPGVDIDKPKLDLKGPKIDLKGSDIDLNGPKLKGPDFNLSGKIPGAELNAPNIDLKGPDYKLEGSIDGINVNTPKIDMPSGNINLKGAKIKNPEFNIDGNIPGVKVNKPKIDIPKPNINVKGPKIDPNFKITGIIPGIPKSSSSLNIKGTRRIPDYNLNANMPEVNLKSSKLRLQSPDIDIKGSRRIPDYDINANTDVNGFIPGINVKGSNNINLPSGNVNLKGPKIDGPNFDLKGNIPGMKINSPNLIVKGPKINGPDYNLKGDIPGIKLNAPKINLNSPNLDINGPKIEGPDYNLKGEIPGMKINVPKVDIKSPNVDLKGPNYDLSGSIPGVNVDTPKIDMPSGNINLRGPNIKSPNIKGPDYNLSGNIPGAKIKGPKIDVNAPNINLNGPNTDYNLSGNIPGAKIKGPKIDVNAPNINLNGPNTDNIISGIIPGSKSYKAGLNINGPNINLKGPNINKPNIDFGGEIKASNNLNGNIPGIKLNSPNIDLNSPNIDIKGPDYNLKGDIPGMKINVPKVDIKDNIDLKGPNYELNGNIPGVTVGTPKIDMPSGNINLRGPNLKGNNLDIKGSSNYNLSGNIPGMKINPKLDIPSGNINIRGPKIKGPDYELSGNIPGIHSNKQDYTLTGIIPSYRYRNKSPNIEIKNSQINQPDIKYSTIDPNININNNLSYRNLKVSTNKGLSPGKKNFHGSVNDPNYLEYSDIKGSRRVLFSSQIDDYNNSRRIDKNKLDARGIKIIDEQDVILQEPYNIDKQVLLHGQKKQTNKKNYNLVVSHHAIQPEMDLGEIKTRQANINIGAPNIELNNEDINIDKNIDLKGGDIDINMNNNIGNLGNLGFKLNNNVENEEIKINGPKIEINNDLEIKQDLPKIDIEKPELEGKINLAKKEPTNLRFKPIKDEEDKKFGINLKFNMNENDEDGSNDENENNTKLKSSERGNSKKRGKGLPMVGIKSSNFQSSKIDVAGKLDVDNIDVNNMKSANVGVNGVKLGERIIE